MMRVNQLPLFILLVSIFAFLLIPTFSFSEEKTLGEDLKGILEYARKENPEIRAYRERVNSFEAKAKYAGILDDPTLKVEFEDIPKENPFPITGKAEITRYTITQMFPFPGKLNLMEKMARKESSMSGEELREKEIEILTMVKMVYFDYYYINKAIGIMKEVKDILSDLEKIAGIRYSTGLVPQQDLIKAQVEISMITNELINMESGKKILKARLNTLLNRPTIASLAAPGDVTFKYPIPEAIELAEKALKRNPMIRAMEFNIEAKDTNKDLTKKNYYPDFMLGISPVQRMEKFSSWDFMVGINIPIWWKKYDYRLNEAKANLNSSKARLEGIKNHVSFEISQACIKVETSKRVIELYETGILPQTRLSLESSLINYQTGKVDFLTLLENQRALKKTRIEHLRALVDYRIGVAEIEKVLGEDIIEN
ncbi:MAG: TolC family protein [Nitrospirae bacterium]|nr:TolC family protein [Nitrospirota bacterium]